MFLRSTKQAYSNLSLGKQSMCRAMTAAPTINPLVQVNAMGFKFTAKPMQVLGQVERRQFSYPDHIVMEMPNLSPTMEKVSMRYLLNLNNRLHHSCKA